MQNLFVIYDKSKRKIYLTIERYKHILKHPDMQNQIEDIKLTLIRPLKIVDISFDSQIKYYYSYYKKDAKFLRVVVKYLNGKGFIITAYFVDRLI